MDVLTSGKVAGVDSSKSLLGGPGGCEFKDFTVSAYAQCYYGWQESNAKKMKEPFGEVGERIFGILFSGLYVGETRC